MSKTALLRAAGLSVGYGGRPVVAGVDLTAESGQILTLIGPNGAGKSTILKTLIGQLPPLEGEILLEGRPLSRLSGRQIARRLSVVLTGRPEPEWMTCEEVVSSGRYPYTGRLGILSTEDRRLVAEAMEQVGVTDLRNADFACLSDGQRQRVMLARAIAQQPRVLVMDEPTSYLDLRHKLDFLILLRDLVREQGLAVVLSLHELDLAQKFSDRVVCVGNGRLDRIGTPEQIFTGAYIERLYGVKAGRFDPLTGSVEGRRPTGEPRVFVLGGGGRGIPVYRQLQRRDIPFAVGVLPQNDVDLPVASALAAAVVTAPPFCPLPEDALTAAAGWIDRCAAVIDCTDPDEPTAALSARAAQAGKRLTPAQIDDCFARLTE